MRKWRADSFASIALAGLSDVFASTPVSLVAGGLVGNLLGAIVDQLVERESAADASDPVEAIEAIKQQLTQALRAVTELQTTAERTRHEIAHNEAVLSQLVDEKVAKEHLLALPREQLQQILSDGVANALRRGRARGWIEAIIVGAIASLIAAGIWVFLVS